MIHPEDQLLMYIKIKLNNIYNITMLNKFSQLLNQIKLSIFNKKYDKELEFYYNSYYLSNTLSNNLSNTNYIKLKDSNNINNINILLKR